MLLFFTGYSRSASAILKEQDDKSKKADKTMVENLHFVKKLGQLSRVALENGDLNEFARLMDVHWQRKKERSKSMSNQDINTWYDHAMANGALGGKVIGAGGGGFLMFYSDDKTRLRHAMREKGLEEVRFRFDFEGTKILNQQDAVVPNLKVTETKWRGTLQPATANRQWWSSLCSGSFSF